MFSRPFYYILLLVINNTLKKYTFPLYSRPLKMICHHMDIYATIGRIYEIVENDRLKDIYVFKLHQYLIQYKIYTDNVTL